MICAMSDSARASKVVLLEDRRAEEDAGPRRPLRRYRLVRLPVGDRSATPAEDRFDYLRRVYD